MRKKMTRAVAKFLSAALVLSLFLQGQPAAEAASTATLTGKEAATATEVLYEENFDSYGSEKIALSTGENEDYNLYVSGGTSYIENGRLYLSGSGYNTTYIMGGEMWGYYTVEADMGHTAESQNWGGLNYYVQSGVKWQKGSLKKDGEAKLNGYENGWVNDINSHNVATVADIAANNLTENDVVRLKIVANGKNASMYYARYDSDGTLGEWQHIIDISNIPASSQSGSVGVVTGSGASVWIDNLKVTRNLDQEASKHNLMSVDFDEYTNGTTATLAEGLNADHFNLNFVKTSGSSASVELKDGRMYMTGNQYDIVYFDWKDAQHWTDYVVEADMCYTTTSGWNGLLYRVQEGGTSAQKGGLYPDGRVGLNGFKSKGGWVNDSDPGMGNKLAAGTVSVAVDTPQRIKIVVKDNYADIYYAAYTDYSAGTMSDWTYLFSIDDIPDIHTAGSVGFMTSGNGQQVSFWVDNIEVYEYANTYVEDFNSYGDVALSTGANNGINGVGVQYTLDGGTTGGSLRVEDGKLEFVATSDSATGNHDVVWFNAGKNWTNYTFETDVTYHNNNQWGTLLTRLDDIDNWVRGGVQPKTRLYLGTYLNGTWANTENVDKWTITTGVTLEEPFRIKFVVQDNCAYLYYAFYENGVLQPYTFLKSIESISTAQYDGTIGFLGVKSASYSLDNIVVAAGPEQVEPEKPTYNLADIAVPETGIVNPPVVVQQVNSAADYTALAANQAAVALMDIDASMNIMDSTGAVITTAKQFLTDYQATVIPAFRIDSGAEVQSLIAFLNDNNIMDAFVVADSDDCDRLLTVRTACPYVGGILEYDEPLNTYEKRAASRRLANNYMASVILMPEGSVDTEISNEYNARVINVWSYASDQAGIYAGIANGYNGVVASDAAMVTEVYKSITATTLSGTPMAIGHRGRTEQYYPENTIEAFRSAYEDAGAAGIETDLKLSKDNEIVLMHDSTIDRSTNGTGSVSNYTVEELKQFDVQAVQDPTYTDKIPTFEEVLAWAKVNAPDLVIYSHMGSETTLLTRFKELVTKYGMEDNVIAFCRYNTAAGYKNSNFGNGLSFIGGNSSGPYDPETGMLALDSQEHALESMLKVFRVYNHQSMPYEYDEVSNGGADDAYYYKMSARGFLGVHSTTNSETMFDRYFITGAGIAGALTDYPNYASDYCVEIDAADTTLEVGQTLEVDKTVKKIKGQDITKTCGIQWISGDALTVSDSSYTMTQPGSAKVVYYADITTADSGVAYRLYSAPVTVTFSALADDASLSGMTYSVAGGDAVVLTTDQITQAATSAGVTVALPASTADDAAIVLTPTTAAANANITANTGVTLTSGAGTATVEVTAEDGTTTAVYTIHFAANCAITFDGNGGVGTMDAAEAVSGGRYALPACTFTAPAGKQFKAWNIGGLEYAAGAYYTVTDDTAVTAVWEIITTGGGGGSSSSRTYDVRVNAVEGGTVKVSDSEAKGGKTVTLTVTPDDGKMIESVTITDNKGDSVPYLVSGNKYSFVMPTRNVTVRVAFAKAAGSVSGVTFVDVKDSDWFNAAVYYAAGKGLMAGTSSDTFSPSVTTSRGMIVTILYSLEGKPAVPGTSGFEDVASGAWYADAVTWAAANKIVAGYSSEAFGPNDSITREQLAAILMSYAKYKGYDVSVRTTLSSFVDADAVSGWAASAMEWAYAERLISGKGSGIIDPTGNATRAETAQILRGFCENVLN